MKYAALDLAARANLAGVGEAVLAMERTGVLLDVDACRAAEARAAADEEDALVALRGWAVELGLGPVASDGIWTSPKQLQALLHGHLGLAPSPFWKKGRVKLDRGDVKLDAVALEYLAGANPEHRDGLRQLLHRRKVWSSLKYLRKLPDYVAADGLIHPVFGSAGDGDERVGAVTGRRACKNPELHQIPGGDEYDIRELFIAGPGRSLVVVDQKALEVVILAHILIVLFNDHQLADMASPGAPDIHSVNALRVFRDSLGHTAEFAGAEEWLAAPENRVEGFKNHPDKWIRWTRKTIKTIWYGLQYGKGGYGFGHTLFDAAGNPLGERRATVMVDGILDAIPGLRLYQDWVMRFILDHGGIPSLAGRWCDLRDLVGGDEWQVRRAWRRALNFPMQGGGADLMGAWLVALHRDPDLRRWGWVTTKEVHDEVVLRGPTESAPEALARVRHHAHTCFPLALPLQTSGEIAANWAEGKH